MKNKKLEFAIYHGRSPFRTQIHTPVVALGLAIPALMILLVAVAFMAGALAMPQVLAAAPSALLVAKREELKAKETILAKVFELAGPEVDLKKVDKIGEEDVSKWSTAQKAEKIRTLNDEMSTAGKEVDSLVEVDRAKDNLGLVQAKIKQPLIHPTAPAKEGDKDVRQIKTLGEILLESKDFQEWHKRNEGGQKDPFNFEFPEIYPSEILAAHELKGQPTYLTKTLFQTSAGWGPESTRIGRVVEAVTRPIGVLDIIPMFPTSQAAVVYMEETTRTHAAAEKAEGAAYAESTFELTERTSPVRKITDSIPVTDEQLDDVPMVGGYLNGRLIFGVRQRLDGQVLTGNGSAPNLEGILNVSGIQTQAKSTDPTPDAIYKAMVKVRVTGRANPNAVVMHPNDWQDIRLLRTADGIYIWGSPAEAGPERIWGLRVVQTDAETENTGLVGDFADFCALFERAGVAVEVGYVGSNFTEGKKTMRAQARFAFVVFRPAAFCTVTGI